jgi:hypothetical protein
MTDNARKTGAAVEAHFQFLMWLVPAIEKFLRTQKFLLGDRIQTTALDVLERLIEATYTRDRKGQLARASIALSPAILTEQGRLRMFQQRGPQRSVARNSKSLA